MALSNGGPKIWPSCQIGMFCAPARKQWSDTSKSTTKPILDITLMVSEDNVKDRQEMAISTSHIKLQINIYIES